MDYLIEESSLIECSNRRHMWQGAKKVATAGIYISIDILWYNVTDEYEL